jgi:hypothetical protein
LRSVAGWLSNHCLKTGEVSALIRACPFLTYTHRRAHNTHTQACTQHTHTQACTEHTHTGVHTTHTHTHRRAHNTHRRAHNTHTHCLEGKEENNIVPLLGLKESCHITREVVEMQDNDSAHTPSITYTISKYTIQHTHRPPHAHPPNTAAPCEWDQDDSNLFHVSTGQGLLIILSFTVSSRLITK